MAAVMKHHGVGVAVAERWRSFQIPLCDKIGTYFGTTMQLFCTPLLPTSMVRSSVIAASIAASNAAPGCSDSIRRHWRTVNDATTTSSVCKMRYCAQIILFILAMTCASSTDFTRAAL